MNEDDPRRTPDDEPPPGERPDAPEAGELSPPDPDKPEDEPMEGNVLLPPRTGD